MQDEMQAGSELMQELDAMDVWPDWKDKCGEHQTNERVWHLSVIVTPTSAELSSGPTFELTGPAGEGNNDDDK
jgi:hypothetical protein